MSKFDMLIKYIPVLKESHYGEWIVDRENDGTPEHPIQLPYVSYEEAIRSLVHDFYTFCETHPEYEYTRYSDILNSYQIAWDVNAMAQADLSSMDAKGVIALLIGAIRADRFCEGALLQFFENGSIVRWLERLKELDDK